MNRVEIGNKAEEIAFNYEKHLVIQTPLRLVRMVSSDPAVGYDIEVIDRTSSPPSFKAIEVKAWNEKGFFIITDNEVVKLKSIGSSAWIYLVDINKEKVIKMINNPFCKPHSLEPFNYKYKY